MGQAEGCCRVGAVLRPREGENVCGDTLMSFRNDCGQWCLLLADGMGSGEAARREFALAYDGTVPFPLTELFCFARWERIGGRQYIIYAFDEKNTPIF